MISYLLTNRKKNKFLSVYWFICWLKRTYNLFPLLSFLFKGYRLKFFGAKIGILSLVLCDIVKKNSKNLVVGDFSYIAKDVNLGLHAKIIIGSNVVVNSGSKLITGTHDIDKSDWPLIKKDIVIDDYAWIATNAIILPGVRIGYGSVIGAGAVIRSDVPPLAVMIGNPAYCVRTRSNCCFNYNPVAFTSYFEAWLDTEKWIKE